MRLSPLQSRLAASLAASLVILALYLFLFAPSAALAAELPPVGFYEALPGARQLDEMFPEASYQSDFHSFGLDVFRRAPAGVAPLDIDKPTALNLEYGKSTCYMVERSALFGNRGGGAANQSPQPLDASPRPLYISANTCLQPSSNGTNGDGAPPPQLILTASNSSETACKGPKQNPRPNEGVVFKEGAATFKFDASSDVFIGITAPNVSTDFHGVYNFELAASLDNYMHQYQEGGRAELLWMDSDSTSALLVTRNLTDNEDDIRRVMGQGPPYDLYVSHKGASAVRGLRHSLCGLQNMAEIKVSHSKDGPPNGLVKTSMTRFGSGNLPKQQFHFVSLNASSSYVGYLVRKPNAAARVKRQDGSPAPQAGSVVFPATEFQTISGTNCKIVTDLSFCTEIQYAVPGNDNKFNNTALAKAYDDQAKAMYANFEKVMMQIPCEAPRIALYSLSRNCDDCKAAYKKWLCSVMMPRCEDFGSSNAFALERNAGQPFPNGTQLPDSVKAVLADRPFSMASRNKFIDETIQPGPYKEVLPCEDLCYEVVQSCPAKIGFKCPQPDMVSFNSSYGLRGLNGSTVSCNYPGEARTPLSAARTLLPSLALLCSFSILATVLSTG
ncbi:hypothetical protein HIM_05019 [Hirsutella minnesotensis 3608]|uniref:Calcium influx-promoting protein ehs1 n=1 Tax=Hirsutella minnesotensis 3608 TaxID=1043627 RepID=A0A0F7ZKR7_9HYPO|nr:hypothetical protein HIM_05019 [Hirsutella minnesotensis 3608]